MALKCKSGRAVRNGRALELTAEDSGTEAAPIAYRARPGDTVHITGGRLVSRWQAVSDSAILRRLDPAAQGHVHEADLKALGIVAYGDLGLDAAWQIQHYLATVDHQGEDAMGSHLRQRRKEGPAAAGSFFYDQPMQLSRWPNDGFIKIEQVLGQTEINVRGVKGCKEGIFVYEGDRPRRWAEEPDAWG